MSKILTYSSNLSRSRFSRHDRSDAVNLNDGPITEISRSCWPRNGQRYLLGLVLSRRSAACGAVVLFRMACKVWERE